MSQKNDSLLIEKLVLSRQFMSAYTKPTLERLLTSVGLIWILLGWVNFHSVFQFLPFPVKCRAMTKCCKPYYHRVISSANTMCTINAGIWDINTCLTKQALNYFKDFDGGFIFLFLHVFDSQIEASTILLVIFKILSIFHSFSLKVRVF